MIPAFLEDGAQLGGGGGDADIELIDLGLVIPRVHAELIDFQVDRLANGLGLGSPGEGMDAGILQVR